MSAPWEMWCDEMGMFSSTKLIRGSAASIRYLRADLTCGDCAFLKEDSDYSVLCVKHSWEIAAENPACMAFVPKKVRP